jgi:hypothetical protein
MKFALIFLAIIGLALAETKIDEPITRMVREIEEGKNYTQCIYDYEKKFLSCRSSVGEIECDSVWELSNSTEKYQMLGLSKIVVDVADVKPESVKYYLYPRKLDNSTYLNRTVEVDGKVCDLYLSYSEKETEVRGLRVSDLKCWEKIVKMFSESIATHSVEIKPDVQVPLFGEILIRDAEIQKRWLWGYGWGYGGWGWGNGYWGYPYGGYWYGK